MNTARSGGFTNPMKIFRLKVEMGDILLFLYVLAFVRQYFWVTDNNLLAWTLSVPLASVAWYFYISTKQFPAERFGRSFWLLVGLPLLAVYMLRAAFPDHSFDVLTYHLLHSERSLHGPLFAPGDFFPTPAPFNPVPDTLTGFSRMILGFRLGTLINVLVLIWAAQITDKILRPLISGAWSRAVCVLVIVLAENLLFEISTYMVDLLALPLMLEATLLTLRAEEAGNRRSNLIHIALLLGASTAFKISNLAVVLPLVAVCVFKAIQSERRNPKRLVKTALLALGAFIAPLLPFAIYMFRLTGNPIFPLANVFFKSPYWPTHGGWDNRWGPQTFWETTVWPVLIWFKPERHSELAVYSGRLSLGFIAAVVGLVLAWQRQRVWTICFLLVASSLLWSATGLGYSRYGLYQEMLAGVAVIAVASALAQKSAARLSVGAVVAAILCFTLAAQTALGFSYFLNKEWGSRVTFIRDPDSYERETKFMLRDRSLLSFLNDEDRSVFKDVQLWLETSPESTGFEVLINPRAPILAGRQPEYFFTRESRRQFIRMVDDSREQRMFTLCLEKYLPAAKQAIVQRGLEVGPVTPVDVPFFSPADRIRMMLIEVLRPQTPEARSKFETSWMNAAFPDSDYREQITALDAPAMMHPGEKVTIRFKVKNLGQTTWPAVGNKEGRYQVNIGDRWLDTGGKVEINGADGRSVMKGDLAPGAEMELQMAVTAPRNPGEYTLEIDMVHEEVTWFYERGATPLHLRVRVGP
jgi:hypothetical protein